MILESLVLVIIRDIREIRGQIFATTDFTDDTDNGGGMGQPTKAN